ncbi:unnamed protein product [Ostreobium quekettii]|uniref:Protein kinase domain-containing protein n=1 Tax=Ostreobium quekettii TaxID=121088 RepID=A0A8S1IRC7_9CHLO|nr:unnamed protein product [Ostreobium quekettii]
MSSPKEQEVSIEGQSALTACRDGRDNDVLFDPMVVHPGPSLRLEGWRPFTVAACPPSGRMECLVHAVNRAVGTAVDRLPEARYNLAMLKFLCQEMDKVKDLLPQLSKRPAKEDDCDLLAVLKQDVEKGVALVKCHARAFNLRTYYKVDKVCRQVDRLCEGFNECFLDLGIPEESLHFKTKMDETVHEEDRRYLYWYLTCIIDKKDIDRKVPDDVRRELEALIAEERVRREFVSIIPDPEIVQGAEIGEGGYGKVFAARWKGQDVAIKKLRNDLSVEARAEFFSEVELHIRLNHPNVVRCFGATTNNAIIMELASSDLEKYCQAHSLLLTLLEQVQLMASSASGLKHLHDSNIVHRDVKTSNFLVFPTSGDDPPIVKIADFGLATAKTETRSKTACPLPGTFAFMAPEVSEGRPHSYCSDVFGFGLTLFELIALSPPYRGLRSEVVIQNRKKKGADPGVFPEECPRELIDLVRRCIDPEGKRRPSMSAVVAELDELLTKV